MVKGALHGLLCAAVIVAACCGGGDVRDDGEGAAAPAGKPMPGVLQIANATVTAAYMAFLSTAESLGFGEPCPMKDAPSEVIHEVLQGRILGQEQALESILNAFHAWEAEQESGAGRTPLVIALVGPTGSGKTETAFSIAEAMLRGGRLLPRDRGYRPPAGLVDLRGEDYTSGHPDEVARNRALLRKKLRRHFLECAGTGVVIVDEMQKFHPEVLDELLQPMDDMRPRVGGELRSVDLYRAVYILVSDVASDSLARMLVSYQASEDGLVGRRAVPHVVMLRSVQEALDAQFPRQGFGRLVQHFAGFLPLGPPEVEGVLDKMLRELGEKGRRDGLWAALRWSEELVGALAGPAYVAYKAYEAEDGRKAWFSTLGARVGTVGTLRIGLKKHMQPWRPEDVLVVALNATAAEPERLREGYRGVEGERLAATATGVSFWWCRAAAAPAIDVLADVDVDGGAAPPTDQREQPTSMEVLRAAVTLPGCAAERGAPRIGGACFEELRASGRCEHGWSGNFLEQFQDFQGGAA